MTGVITLLVALISFLASGAWAMKENADDHKSDVQALHAEVQRVLDVVCIDHPDARQCRP